jgi:predicted  nucleic acid-binding Zn-ribbon protein
MKVMSLEEGLWTKVASLDEEIRKLGKQMSDIRRNAKREIAALSEQRNLLVAKRRKLAG